MPDTTPTTDRNGLAALLAHHADVLAARWYSVAPGPGAWEVAAALALRDHASDLTAEEETPFVREFLDSVLAFEADEQARQVLGTTDQQPATVLDGLEPVQLRWGLDDVMYGDDDTTTVLLSGPDGEPYWVEMDPERTAALRNALAGPDALPEFELRGDTEIRAAVLREAADYAQQVAKAMATADEDWASRAGWACASVATGLRRLAAEAQQEPTDADVIEAHEFLRTLVAGADEAQQLETDAHPTEEQIVREHVTTVHLIGEQLEAVESYLWERLAEVREAASAADQPDTETEAAPLPGPPCIPDHSVPVHCPGCADQPDTEPEAQFGLPGCTCIPWTRQGGAPRLLGPDDTVDQIGGWERALDCPHHPAP